MYQFCRSIRKVFAQFSIYVNLIKSALTRDWRITPLKSSFGFLSLGGNTEIVNKKWLELHFNLFH